ncbi:hypothetical protein [Phormidesmis priestleyi]
MRRESDFIFGLAADFDGISVRLLTRIERSVTIAHVLGSLLEKATMDAETIKERIKLIETKRESLVRLLEQPDLGTLRIDVNQALEEMDDLIEEFKRTFPQAG